MELIGKEGVAEEGVPMFITYFGLYGSNRYKACTEKADRKIEFFQSLKDYKFIVIVPDDFRENGFRKIASLLISNGITASCSLFSGTMIFQALKC